jgi:serine/threonine protein phosphatase 1
MRTIAIGDIHGCQTALAKLLEELDPRPEDLLIFLGDYIDRGPASRAVIDLLIQRSGKSPCVFLRGNHEVMILEGRRDPLKASMWQSYGGLDMLESYGGAFEKDWSMKIPDAHWKFLQGTVRAHEDAKNIYVHAFLHADLDVKDQPDALIMWNYFDGIRPHKSGKRVICGHTPQSSRMIKDLGYAVCVDTGAATGGWLTGLEIGSGDFVQTNQQGDARKGKLAGWK